MRDITLTDVDTAELRAALDAEGLTDVDVSEPDGEGQVTVSVPDDVDGVHADGVLNTYAAGRASAGLVATAIGYKVYVALFSQTGVNDPAVTVLKNTLGGDPVWTRDGAGVNVGFLAGAFPPARTVSPNKFQILSPPTSADLAMSVSVATEDSVSVETTTFSTGAFIDDALDATLVEIRVYDET
jgi:hypothetical protein